MSSENPFEKQGTNEDVELSALLKQWKPPEFPAVLDARITEEAHRLRPRLPSWKWLLTAKVPVPVPVAALALLLLCATTFFAIHTQKPTSAFLPQTAAPVVRVKSDIPVPHVAATNPVKTSEPNPELRPAAPATKKADSGSTYVTHVDLTGFEPVKELKIRILTRGDNNER